MGRVLAWLMLVIGAVAASAAAPLKNTADSTLALTAGSAPGAFEIAVNGKAWFSSGNISVTVGGRTHSTADGSLKPKGAAISGGGTDMMGAFTSMTQKWTAGATPYTTDSKLYAAGGFIIFEQSFPTGATGTNVTQLKGSSLVSSCYPSIDTQPAQSGELGYVWWGGRAFLEGSQGGTWKAGDSKDGPGVGVGDGGGPFVVFGEDMVDSLVFSPASNFMINTPGMSSRPGPAGAAPPNAAEPQEELAAGSRGYEIFPSSYCTAPLNPPHVFNGLTVAQCRAKCDSMACACFDISQTDPKSSCRINSLRPPAGSKNTTKSANELEAFVFCGGAACGGPAPPPIPPAPTPPPPPTSDGSLCFGIDAPVESVPAGASLSSIVFLGSGKCANEPHNSLISRDISERLLALPIQASIAR